MQFLWSYAGIILTHQCYMWIVSCNAASVVRSWLIYSFTTCFVSRQDHWHGSHVEFRRRIFRSWHLTTWTLSQKTIFPGLVVVFPWGWEPPCGAQFLTSCKCTVRTTHINIAPFHPSRLRVLCFSQV